MKYLYLFFALIATLLIFSVAAYADCPDDNGDIEEIEVECTVYVTIEEIAEFELECFFEDVVLDECSDFVDCYNLGYIEYSVCANVPWELTGCWEAGSDEDPDCTPFPDDWYIEDSPDGMDNWTAFAECEDTEVLDSAEPGFCDEIAENWYFRLVGPDLCDLPDCYAGELEFTLGPV